MQTHVLQTHKLAETGAEAGRRSITVIVLFLFIIY